MKKENTITFMFSALVLMPLIISILMYLIYGIQKFHVERINNYYNFSSILVMTAFFVFISILFPLYINLMIKNVENKVVSDSLLRRIKYMMIYTMASTFIMFIGILTFFSDKQFHNIDSFSYDKWGGLSYYCAVNWGYHSGFFTVIFNIMWMAMIVVDLKKFIINKP